jgi:hypothetical protein
MVVSRAGFMPVAVEMAEAEGLGKVDLLSPGDLRNWVSKFDQPEASVPKADVRRPG